jgi:NADH-quinone oxidoreductase subunit J
MDWLPTVTQLLFVLFGGLALGCAVAMVAQRNPLYSAISLVGVFVSLACLYMLLQAPFIAAIQVIVYAGAIMVLVVFVIMLLNVEEEARRPLRLTYLIPVGVLLAAVLVGEAAFMLQLGSGSARITPAASATDVGLTASIGTGMFTKYLLPFEVTSVLILMALVGAITLARQGRTPLFAAPGSPTEEPAALSAGRGGAAITPGDTAATGRAFAQAQIERGDAAAPSDVPRERAEKEEG